MLLYLCIPRRLVGGRPVSASITATSTASCSFWRHWMDFQMDGCWCPIRCLYLLFHPSQTLLVRGSPVTVASCTFQDAGGKSWWKPSHSNYSIGLCTLLFWSDQWHMSYQSSPEVALLRPEPRCEGVAYHWQLGLEVGKQVHRSFCRSGGTLHCHESSVLIPVLVSCAMCSVWEGRSRSVHQCLIQMLLIMHALLPVQSLLSQLRVPSLHRMLHNDQRWPQRALDR